MAVTEPRYGRWWNPTPTPVYCRFGGCHERYVRTVEFRGHRWELCNGHAAALEEGRDGAA